MVELWWSVVKPNRKYIYKIITKKLFTGGSLQFYFQASVAEATVDLWW
jgi:hypothetical protein